MKKIFLMVDGEHKIAQQVYINISTKSKIQGIICDNQMNSFFNLPVYTLEMVLENNEPEDILIIICDAEYTLNHIRKLQSYHLRLMNSWIPHWLAGKTEIDPLVLYEFVGGDLIRFAQAINEIKKEKKVMIIYGNCQTVAIRYYLEKVPEFCAKYLIFSLPKFWIEEERQKYDKIFELNILGYADILITQNISAKNKFGARLATDNVCKYTSKECKIIRIANCFSSGYYPQYRKNENCELINGINEDGLKIYKNQLDYNVCRLIYEGKTVNEIVSEISRDDFYSATDIYNYAFSELECTKKRELLCDIKITDYIEDNYTKKIMFESDQHPTEDAICELCRRIVSFLGIKAEIPRDLQVHSIGLPGDERTPIYPSILKWFGLKNKSGQILYKLPVTGRKVIFEDYMRSYIRTVFPFVKEE